MSESSNARQGIKTKSRIPLESCRLRPNHRMPVRALRLSNEIPPIPVMVSPNHRMPVRALRPTFHGFNPFYFVCTSESSNARQGIKTFGYITLNPLSSASPNHRMPVRALRLSREMYVPWPLHQSESSNARQGIKTL